MGIVVIRSPRCLRGLLRRIFGLKCGTYDIHNASPAYHVTKPETG